MYTRYIVDELSGGRGRFEDLEAEIRQANCEPEAELLGLGFRVLGFRV